MPEVRHCGAASTLHIANASNAAIGAGNTPPIASANSAGSAVEQLSFAAADGYRTRVFGREPSLGIGERHPEIGRRSWFINLGVPRGDADPIWSSRIPLPLDCLRFRQGTLRSPAKAGSVTHVPEPNCSLLSGRGKKCIAIVIANHLQPVFPRWSPFSGLLV